MLELTLAKPTRTVAADAAAGWLLRLWRAAVRHAERPGRFVPYC